MLVAVIGIGSNSLRMLIANVKDAQLHRVLRDREGLRVFAALDDQKNISQEMMCRAAQSVKGFLEKARAHKAEKIHIFATSAVRDARNQEAFCEAIFQATGLRPEVCSGDLEASLSFLGVAEEKRVGMIDIGGGSTEIVVGDGFEILHAASLQMGAVRLFRKEPILSAQDMYRVVDQVKKKLAAEIPLLGPYGKVGWVGVGGTFTTLAALLQNISWSDKKLIHGYQASLKDIAQCAERLAPMNMEERSALRGLQPQRADIVVHGMAILLGFMQSLDIDSIAVSEYGNLEGYLKYKYTLV